MRFLKLPSNPFPLFCFVGVAAPPNRQLLLSECLAGGDRFWFSKNSLL